MTILDYIRKNAETYPLKTAVVCKDKTLTYSQLYSAMQAKVEIPIPLLGEAWDKPFLLNTTGTTGKSKTVVVSQDAVIANSENLISAHGYTCDTVFIIAGAITHLGSWSKIFPVLISGGTLIILDSMKNIDDFFLALDYPSQKMATFLVPSNIRILLQFAAERLSRYASKIDFIETGAAPMPHTDMLRLCGLLPQSRLFNTYASTETGIIATYNYNDGRCLQGCFQAMKHSSFFITPDGRIACKGKTLMSGYLDDPEATAKVLRDGCVYTSDNGYVDDEGMLHITGREDDVINVGGFKVAPSVVEDVASELPEIRECICIPMKHPILGSAPKLLVVLHEGFSLDKKKIAQYISSQIESYNVPLAYQQVDHIERTFNGKPNRKFYSST